MELKDNNPHKNMHIFYKILMTLTGWLAGLLGTKQPPRSYTFGPDGGVPIRPDWVYDPPMYRPGYVYVAKSEDGLYKIGCSKEPTKRFKNLSAAHTSPLMLIRIIPVESMMACEKYLHDRFAVRRVHGEWFALEPADVEYLMGIEKLIMIQETES